MKLEINGITLFGRTVSLKNGVLKIDGKKVDIQPTDNAFEIRVLEGTIQELSSDGSVTCNDVKGNVSAGGSVKCGSVGGNASAGGSINCDGIAGNAVAGGSIRGR